MVNTLKPSWVCLGKRMADDGPCARNNCKVRAKDAK
jgi:hypothetical protein